MRFSEQEGFDIALFGIRQQGGPSKRCHDEPYRGGAGCYFTDDPRGRSCALGLIDKRVRYATVANISTELMDAHNRSAYEANTDAEFFTVWEPRMKEIAQRFGLNYTPLGDPGFAAFRAKILAPLPVESAA